MSSSFSSYYHVSMTVSVVALVVGLLSTFTYVFGVMWLGYSVRFWWVYALVLLNGLAAASLAMWHDDTFPAVRLALGVHVVVGVVCGYFLTGELRVWHGIRQYERATEAVRARDWAEFERLLPKLPRLPKLRTRRNYLRRDFFQSCYWRSPAEAPPLDTVEAVLLHLGRGRNPSILAAAGCRHDLTIRLLERHQYSEERLSWALAYARLPETMDALLEAGANPQFRFQGRRTPLMEANSPDIARRLIAAGADPLAVDANGEGVRHYHGRGADRRRPYQRWWRPDGTPTWTELWDEHGVPPLPPDQR